MTLARHYSCILLITIVTKFFYRYPGIQKRVIIGVKVQFSHPVATSRELADLPPDSIISTGLCFEGYDALNIPYMKSFHFIARKSIDESASRFISVISQPTTPTQVQ